MCERKKEEEEDMTANGTQENNKIIHSSVHHIIST